MEKDRDIFDKIMDLPFLKYFKNFFNMHREKLLYLFFGAITTIVSLISFNGFFYIFDLNEHISNVASWILAVLCAFYTSRKWVFRKDEIKKSSTMQLIDFFKGRLITLAFEEILVFIFITVFKLNAFIIKLITTAIVIILNYCISKYFVFTDKGEKE